MCWGWWWGSHATFKAGKKEGGDGGKGGGIGSGVESEDTDKNKESHLTDKFGSRRPGGMIFYFPFF